MLDSKKPRFGRILLKLSGEALAGNKDMGIDAQVLDQMSLSIAHLVGLGVQVERSFHIYKIDQDRFDEENF